jgi:rRNA maturation RNase YbeY
MISVSNTTKSNPPVRGLLFVDMANTILGKSYELSLVFAGDTLARRLNRERRDKTYIPNILSFTLSDSEGEIFINLNKCKKEASKFGYSYKDYIIFLFIHGCCHLKGHDHSDAMENMEKKFRRKFKLKDPQ